MYDGILTVIDPECESTVQQSFPVPILVVGGCEFGSSAAALRARTRSEEPGGTVLFICPCPSLDSWPGSGKAVRTCTAKPVRFCLAWIQCAIRLHRNSFRLDFVWRLQSNTKLITPKTRCITSRYGPLNGAGFSRVQTKFVFTPI